MADKKMMVPVRLWAAEGGEHLHEIEYEMPEDGSQPQAIEHGGKLYVWNQRNSQYRQVEAVKSAGKADADAIAPAQAAAKDAK